MQKSLVKKLLIITLLSFSLHARSQKYEIFPAKEKTETDIFFDHYHISDKYRWLEDVNNPETIEWVDRQNELSGKYLSKVTRTSDSYQSIRDYSLVDFHSPRKMGNYYFTIAYSDGYRVPALYYQSRPNDDLIELVNPNDFSNNDRITFQDYSVSNDSRFLAYQYSRNGSDWGEVGVVALKSRKQLSDHLKGLKFSDITWHGNGFFYSTFSQEGKFGITQGQGVYYHKIGDEQQSDSLIFQRKNNPAARFSCSTTSDERFFIIKERNPKTGVLNIYYIDYQSENPHVQPLITNLTNYEVNIIEGYEGKFIAKVRKDFNNTTIAEIDPAQPYKWRPIGYNFEDAFLQEAIPFKDRLILVYQFDQRPSILVFNYAGEMLYRLDMPVATSVSGFMGNSTDEELLFNFQSYTIPPLVYKFNILTFKKELTQNTTVKFSFTDIEYKDTVFISNDSVKVPLILVYKKGLKLDGSNPAILSAYGGFNVVDPPSFDPGIVYFIRHGGIYAFANIRGGGDKGAKWAQAGRGPNKQNSFDDFIAAAEFLISGKYTGKEKLAATGASNGGLVVAAAAIQRPDLFRVVVPVVAPLDMLRFEKFTVGQFWAGEYGTVKDSLSFTRLLAYSPYQNIREDVNYPAMLVLTSENDDRVPPFHSYKFVARLQNRSAQVNPVLLRTEKKAGHYGASTHVSNIEEKADVYGFIMNEIMKVQN